MIDKATHYSFFSITASKRLSETHKRMVHLQLNTMDTQTIFEKVYDMVEQYKNEPYVEMEMRLGKYNGKMFDTNIGKENFEKILGGLTKYNGWEEKHVSEVEVYYIDKLGIRLTIDEKLNTEKCVRKTNIKNEDFRHFKTSPYDLRFSISREVPMARPTDDFDKTRVKKRHSFVRKNLSIDMTVVSGDCDDKDSEDPYVYQVELEIINPKEVDSKNKLFNIIHKITDVLKILPEDK